MRQDALEKLFSVSLKARILRAWQSATSAGESTLSEREVLTLELIEAFPDISVTEKKLSRVFAISASSVCDMAKRLEARGFLKREIGEDEIARGKPLRLTEAGKEQLEGFRKSGAARFSYLFSSIEADDWDLIVRLLEKVDQSATDAIRRNIFDILA